MAMWFLWLNGFMWLKVVKGGEKWGKVRKSGENCENWGRVGKSGE